MQDLARLVLLGILGDCGIDLSVEPGNPPLDDCDEARDVFAKPGGSVLEAALLGHYDLDQLPASRHNPDGTGTPAYASRIALAGRWVLGIALVAFGIAFVQSGIAAGSRSELPFIAGIALACLFFSIALIVRRTWLLLAALASGFGGIAISALSH